MSVSIAIAVLTYNGEKHLQKCLTPLLNCGYKVLVIDSSSQDGTVLTASKMGAEVIVIPQHEFNHGLTREKARLHLGTDIVVMITQDAYITNPDSIRKLVEPIVNSRCAVTYGRQIPHSNAGFFESFPREFNYPQLENELQIRTINDIPIYGAKTFFCSDSFSAYDNRKLTEVGGFPETLTNEDYLATFKLLQNGYKIGYVSTALIYHSHKYSLFEEFKRHFDAGYIRGKFRQIEKIAGATEKSGGAFAWAFLKATAHHNFLLLPYSLLICISKYVGFRIGFIGPSLPPIICQKLSSQPYYWAYRVSRTEKS